MQEKKRYEGCSRGAGVNVPGTAHGLEQQTQVPNRTLFTCVDDWYCGSRPGSDPVIMVQQLLPRHAWNMVKFEPHE